MSKQDFKDYICRPFCMFFREGQKEEMACQGAEIIERLVRLGRLNPAALPREGKDSCSWENRDTALEVNVCKSCPFKREDCDFQSERPPPDAAPCGGYILLSLLKAIGIITSIDLEEAAGE
jgi:hypothetical protein